MFKHLDLIPECVLLVVLLILIAIFGSGTYWLLCLAGAAAIFALWRLNTRQREEAE